ncbi:MAG TPA: imidazole glycerol phosphate synthase subunit HisH [Caulobacteraceae bacterium]|jgi:glutamine amidotransferase|nr:imidazole glycerol phosphate synthase subunit HisH [Caulobacteraceae bacterium]
MRRVVLIDYGSGNLPSAEKALRRAADGVGDVEVRATDDADAVAAADALVLPGVGAFAACMSALEARPGVVEAMAEAVRDRGVPFLGICVGMQLMAERGLEFGATQGLGWIEGEVRRLEPHGEGLKIPHMGWNGLDTPRGALFAGLPAGAHMYFTHAFALFPADEACVAARTDHGGPFVSAVTRDNLAGVQFHPEKSQDAGARLLRNFLEWRP